MNKPKLQRRFSDTEESTKSEYEDSDYLPHPAEKEDEEQGSPVQDFLVETFYNKKFLTIILSVILSIIATFSMNKQVEVSENPQLNELPVGGILFALAFFVLFNLLLGYTLEIVTLRILKKSKSTSSSFVFYVNECSYYISTVIGHLSLLFLILLKTGDLCLKITENFRLKMSELIPASLILLLFLTLQKCLVSYTTFSFNYSTYIRRIKRVIYMDLFVSLVSRNSEFVNNHKNFTEKQPDIDNQIITQQRKLLADDTNGNHNSNDISNDNDDNKKQEIEFKTEENDLIDDNDVLVARIKTHRPKNPISTYIFDEKFKENSMTFGAQFLLLKEFGTLCTNSRFHEGSIIRIFSKIRAKAHRKTLQIFKKAVGRDRIKTVADLGPLFKKPSDFRHFVESINCRKDDSITVDFLEFFIEKCLKEKYLISFSLKQLTAAIERVSAVAIFLTVVLYLLCVYISATGKITALGEMFSALFGVPIIVLVVKDNIIGPIMFLFVIHPYDVGDRVLIEIGGREENLVVSELNVFSTCFFRWDGTSFFVPNNLLFNKSIINIRRSGPTMEYHHVQISANTDPSRIADLKSRLQSFVRNHRSLYTDYILVNYDRIEDAHRLCLKILVQYKTNCQNHEHYLNLRSNFICFLNKQLKALNISYELPTQNITMFRKNQIEQIGSFKKLLEE